MRLIKKSVSITLVLLLLLAVCAEIHAQERSNGDLSPAESIQAIGKGKIGDKGKPQEADEVPNIGDIIPLATKLSARAAALENSLNAVPDLTKMQGQDERIEKELKELSSKLEEQKGLEAPRYQNLSEIRKAIQRESDLLQKNDEPLKEAINRLQSLQKEWFVEKKQWTRWQEAVLKNGGVEKLAPVFSKSEKTIDSASRSIEAQLEKMLARQEKSAAIQSKINNLVAEIDGLITKASQETALSTSPLMVSKEYFSNFRFDLLHRMKMGLTSVSWIEGPFFARQGWVAVVQLFITILLVVQIYRHRTSLRAFDRLSLLSERPISAGLYLGIMITLIFYDLRGAPAAWRMAQVVIGGIALARLSAELFEFSWKKNSVYTLLVVLALNRFFTLINLPFPLARLYTVLASLTGLLLCLRWARQAAAAEGASRYVYGFRMGALFLGYIALAEIWGQGEFPQYLFVSAVNTLSIVIGFILFMYLIRGSVEWFVS